MKVSELMDKLKDANPDLEVHISYTSTDGKHGSNHIEGAYNVGHSFIITPLSNMISISELNLMKDHLNDLTDNLVSNINKLKNITGVDHECK